MKTFFALFLGQKKAWDLLKVEVLKKDFRVSWDIFLIIFFNLHVQMYSKYKFSCTIWKLCLKLCPTFVEKTNFQITV